MKIITVDQLVSSLLAALPDCQAIYRFGSWGTDAQRTESDIDLAVLPSHPLEPVYRWELAQTLASLAGRDVDLVGLYTPYLAEIEGGVSKGRFHAIMSKMCRPCKMVIRS